LALSPLSILVLVGGGIWFFWAQNVLLIRNASGKTIETFTLVVCNRSHHLEDVADGETTKLSFWVTGDSNFQIDVKFQDGTTLSSSFGYVTGGAGAFHNRATTTVRSHVIEGSQQVKR
jgi:hypothetical protein